MRRPFVYCCNKVSQVTHAEARIAFVKNGHGHVTRLTLRQKKIDGEMMKVKTVSLMILFGISPANEVIFGCD